MPADRREFLTAGAAAAAVSLLPTTVHAASDNALKVGLVGCGGRGSGAVKDAMEAADIAGVPVKLWAVADVFADRARRRGREYADKYGTAKVDLTDRVFGGLDGYQKVIDSGVDVVLLATPPGFRPQHLEAAVKAKKHIFTEKPVAVDGPGIRQVLAAADAAEQAGLSVVAGTQRRHQAGYLETVKRIHDGAIGEVVGGRCAWNGQGIWFNRRNPNEPDSHYQVRNWYHFVWLCGDHICEQHVHNLDVINWVLGARPVKAKGIGGRLPDNPSRPPGDPKEVGHIWDHFAVEFEYPNGVTIASYCAHIPDIQTDISESVVGTKGSAQVDKYVVNRKRVADRDPISPYVQEHVDLLNSIRDNKPLAELRAVAESTMTAILGREACYTGKVLTWNQVLNAKRSLMPVDLTLESALDTPPVPLPGKYKLV